MVCRGVIAAGLVSVCLLGSDARAQEMVQPESLEQGFIIVVEDKSKVATTSDPIFMPSSHNGWNPGDPGARLEQRSDMRWQIVMEKPELDSRIAFKFARGSWERVETDAQFQNIENRLLPEIDRSKLAPGERPVIELVIANWADKGPQTVASVAMNRYQKIDVSSGKLTKVEVVGGGVPIMRDVLVWTPPGYDDPENANRSYPVLYMQDGQNLFMDHGGIPAEWRADETAGRLIEAGRVQPLIIVGIPSANEQRIQEYVPVRVYDRVPARGEAYVGFLVHEVMPRVERLFRVKDGPENTGVGGASLGGIISLEAGTRHPDIFGKVLCESAPMVRKNGLMLRHFSDKETWPGKLYFGMGGKEAGRDPSDTRLNARYVESAERFREMVEQRGDVELKFVVDDDAVHNEEAWAERFGAALEFLFPAE